MRDRLRGRPNGPGRHFVGCLFGEVETTVMVLMAREAGARSRPSGARRLSGSQGRASCFVAPSACDGRGTGPRGSPRWSLWCTSVELLMDSQLEGTESDRSRGVLSSRASSLRSGRHGRPVRRSSAMSPPVVPCPQGAHRTDAGESGAAQRRIPWDQAAQSPDRGGDGLCPPRRGGPGCTLRRDGHSRRATSPGSVAPRPTE